jgi:hypothetical protein
MVALAFIVIAGLVPAIHDLGWCIDVAPSVILDARNKCGHDTIGIATDRRPRFVKEDQCQAQW